MLDIGESLVGSYLRYVENCDFVHYETYGEGQGPPPPEALPYPAAAAEAGRTTPTPATLRARLPGASCLPCSPHPSMIDSH
jgi:hypothetical protein